MLYFGRMRSIQSSHTENFYIVYINTVKSKHLHCMYIIYILGWTSQETKWLLYPYKLHHLPEVCDSSESWQRRLLVSLRPSQNVTTCTHLQLIEYPKDICCMALAWFWNCQGQMKKHLAKYLACNYNIRPMSL